jgi:hypothetical protein
MTDIVAWSHLQAELLAQLADRTDERSREVDWENVIEEVLSVGRSQVRGVARKIELVLAHLLKAVSDPDAPSRRGWRHEIDTWRNRLQSEFTPPCAPSSISTRSGREPGRRRPATWTSTGFPLIAACLPGARLRSTI